jgi:adenosine deaminase
MTEQTITLWNDRISRMPKVELHLHLEGAFTFSTLLSLINKYGGETGVHTIEDLQRRFAYIDFPHFIEIWKWKNKFFRTPEDFELSVFESLRELRTQNVLYVEAFYSPWDFEGNGLTMREITRAVIRGCRKAREQFGIRCSLIADINRDFGPEAGGKRIDDAAEFLGQGVIGIGLGGSEHLYPAELFEKVFAKAHTKGLHCVAHAGEAAGASSVWAALNTLKAERIGHGTRAIEDPVLMKELKRRKIPIEVCMTSNVCTGVVKSVEVHPVKQFLDSGLPVTINTDDPTMFNCTLEGEYKNLLTRCGVKAEMLRTISYASLNASFLDDKGKQELRSAFDLFWNNLPAA